MTWQPHLEKTTPREERVWKDNEEILEEFCRFLKDNGYSENVQAHYPVDLRVFMAMWGTTLVTTLEDEDIQLFVDQIAKKCSKLMRRRENPMCLKGLDLATCPLLTGKPESEYHACPGYQPVDVTGILSYLRSIQSFYQWLLEAGYIKWNPAKPVFGRFLRRHKATLQRRRRNPRRRVLKPDEVRILVEKSPIHRAIICAFLAKCFMRIHEVMKLSVDPQYFNLKEGWLEIPPDRAYGDKRIGNNRIIIDQELRRLLDRYMRWREWKVKRDESGRERTDKLVLTMVGMPWCPKGFQGNFKNMMHKDCIRLGLMTGKETKREERINPHCFRAFATTWARDHGANDGQLQVLRGDKAPGAIDPYDFHIARLPALYREFAPVLGVS